MKSGAQRRANRSANFSSAPGAGRLQSEKPSETANRWQPFNRARHCSSINGRTSPECCLRLPFGTHSCHIFQNQKNETSSNHCNAIKSHDSNDSKSVTPSTNLHWFFLIFFLNFSFIFFSIFFCFYFVRLFIVFFIYFFKNYYLFF